MDKQLELDIDGRKFLAVHEGNKQNLTDKEFTGCYDILEGEKIHGWICFTADAWEYDDDGDLTYIEVEAIAEAIQFHHKA